MKLVHKGESCQVSFSSKEIIYYSCIVPGIAGELDNSGI